MILSHVFPDHFPPHHSETVTQRLRQDWPQVFKAAGKLSEYRDQFWQISPTVSHKPTGWAGRGMDNEGSGQCGTAGQSGHDPIESWQQLEVVDILSPLYRWGN